MTIIERIISVAFMILSPVIFAVACSSNETSLPTVTIKPVVVISSATPTPAPATTPAADYPTITPTPIPATVPGLIEPPAVYTPVEIIQPTSDMAICPPIDVVANTIHFPSEEFSGSLAQAFKPQILDYLNLGGSPDGLQKAFSDSDLSHDDVKWNASLRIELLDVTADRVPDVVIGLVLSAEQYDFSDGFLWVFSCLDSEYQAVHEEYIGGILFSEPDGIRFVGDMNSNDIPEIVFSLIDNVGAHGYYTRPFSIIEWDGAQFVERIDFGDLYDTGETVAHAVVFNGDGTVIDTDGDGTLELVLTNGIAGHYGGPQRSRRDTVAWNGSYFSLSHWEHDAPTYRFQAVRDGDDAAGFGRYEDAIAFYQQAVNDDSLLGWQAGYYLDLYAPTPPAPDPAERPRLVAYSRYRLLLLHAHLGNLEVAENTYNSLREDYPTGNLGYRYAELAESFWSEYMVSRDMAKACDSALQFAQVYEQELLDPLGPSFYGESALLYSSHDLCPFTDAGG